MKTSEEVKKELQKLKYRQKELEQELILVKKLIIQTTEELFDVKKQEKESEEGKNL